MDNHRYIRCMLLAEKQVLTRAGRGVHIMFTTQLTTKCV